MPYSWFYDYYGKSSGKPAIFFRKYYMVSYMISIL